MNRLDVAKKACARVGVNDIDSFDQEGSQEARVMRTNYDSIVGNEQEKPWKYSRGQFEMQLTNDVAYGWEEVYSRPPGVLYTSKVMVDGRTVGWQRYGDKIAIDCVTGDAPVVLEGSFDLKEHLWPGYFMEIVVMRLAAALALGVLRDGELAQAISGLADKQVRVARHTDSTQQTQGRIQLNMLRAARLG